METVDSRQEQLDPHEIIAMASHQQDLSGIDPVAAMLAIAQESASESLDMKQIGNTMFMAHIGKGKHKNQASMRPINVDTAQNLVENFIEYFDYIRGKGIRQIISKFEYEPYVNLVKTMYRQIKARTPDSDISVRLGRTESGAYLVQLDLGGED